MSIRVWAFLLLSLFPLSLQADLIVIVDIDDLLVSTATRTLAILHRLALENQNWHELNHLRKEHVRFLASDTLKQAGLEKLIPEITGAYRKSPWGQKFFGPEFISYDEEIPGASEFFRKLQNKMEHIQTIYLTGRWNTDEIRTGTIHQLKKFKFPFGPSMSFSLRLKPNLEDDDVAFKANEVPKIIEQGHTIVMVFDDSKANLVGMYQAIISKQSQLPYMVRLVRDQEDPLDFKSLEVIPKDKIVQITKFPPVIDTDLTQLDQVFAHLANHCVK